jgi:hypothetical protein
MSRRRSPAFAGAAAPWFDPPLSLVRANSTAIGAHALLSNVHGTADEKTHFRPLKNQMDRAQMWFPSIAGTRLDNLEVKASYHAGGVGCV